ncbi:GIY-YIG nuclease family protein [Streptomyces sp. NPDC058667]|uniref:GIY-YIG nuclease family protein n=1 Tax=Streptomyces sp. NPDC058667 TaxID=3346588 RepID=UPI003662FC59
MVYVVSSEASPNMIKIGVATNLAQRLKSLQSGSGALLIARWTSRGGLAPESGLRRVSGIRLSAASGSTSAASTSRSG